VSILDVFSRSVSGQAAADLGYVNPGTDRRIGGELGKLLGRTQSQLSFKSDTPPTKHVERIGNVLVETATAPNGRVHYALAVPRSGGRFATLRFGWRWDGNWGDERTIGFNPSPEIVGGYIADGILKWNATQTFIDGHEHG
jgi:hypothetical protein